MKRIFTVFLSVLILFSYCLAENAVEDTDIDTEDVLVFDYYVNKNVGFQVGAIPDNWIIFGTGSTEEQITEARYTLANYSKIASLITPENDCLICTDEAGTLRMFLTYGERSSMSNDDISKYADTLIDSVKTEHRLWTFETSSVSYNSIFDILCIKMTRGEINKDTILQYYLIAGPYLYCFTFYNVEETTALTTVNSFSLI